MALCDILVCLDATVAGGGRLDLAFDLAQADKAHLTAVYALPEPRGSAAPPAGVGLPPTVLGPVSPEGARAMDGLPISAAAPVAQAVREAERALEHDDVPIGAVVVRGGEVLAAAHNERELRQDPTAHAELIALREAARAGGSWRVLDSVIYVTLEPCPMCAGAIVLARVPRVVYGAADPKAGACGSVLDILAEPRLNHRPEVAGGLLAQECGELLGEFFASRR